MLLFTLSIKPNNQIIFRAYYTKSWHDQLFYLNGKTSKAMTSCYLLHSEWMLKGNKQTGRGWLNQLTNTYGGAYLKDNNKVLSGLMMFWFVYHSDGFYISACIIVVILDVMIQNHSIFLLMFCTMISKPLMTELSTKFILGASILYWQSSI